MRYVTRIAAMVLALAGAGGCGRDEAGATSNANAQAPPPAGRTGPPPVELPLNRLVGRTYGEVRAELLQRGYRPIPRIGHCGESRQCTEFPEAEACSQGLQHCTFRFARNGVPLTVTTSGENEDDAGAVTVSYIADESEAAAAPILSLTPLSDAEMEVYAGAGCAAAYRGNTVFVTDMQGGAVRYEGRLIRLRRADRNPSFNPNNERNLTWVEGANPGGGLAISFAPQPERMTRDPANESTSRPARMTATMAGATIQEIDVVLTCGS